MSWINLSVDRFTVYPLNIQNNYYAIHCGFSQCLALTAVFGTDAPRLMFSYISVRQCMTINSSWELSYTIYQYPMDVFISSGPSYSNEFYFAAFNIIKGLFRSLFVACD